jgi:hypothetical protein
MGYLNEIPLNWKDSIRTYDRDCNFVISHVASFFGIFLKC